MEQSHELSRVRINSGNIGAFEPITVKACQCEILTDSFAAMLARDDVVYLKGKPILGMRHAVIFAPILGSLPNQRQQLLVH